MALVDDEHDIPYASGEQNKGTKQEMKGNKRA
jgi:hypothetical protein